MSWSSPHTFVSTEKVSAATLNTYVSNNLQYLYDNRFDVTNYGVAPLLARCSGALTCTGSYQDITGCSLTLGGAGDYVILGVSAMLTGGTSAWRWVYTRLAVDGAAQDGIITLYAPDQEELKLPMIWKYTAASSGLIAKLQGAHSGDTNTIQVTNTFIAAHQLEAP